MADKSVKKRPHSDVKDDSFSSLPDDDADLEALNTRDLLKRNADLIVKCTLLNAENQSLLAENEALKISMASFTPTSPSDVRSSSLSSTAPDISSLSSRVKLSGEVAALNQKSYQAVVERLYDAKNKNQDDLDKQFIDDICIDADLRCPIEVFRHDCDSERRPLKTIPPRCRRDMTLTELSLLRRLRKKAYEDNVKVNAFKYYVRDLEIVELDTPRPFKVWSRREEF
ncbi:unnamed protein product [Caenorhabditis auriculariae]|uniref:Uncharacterized protein n=1 Tax=Caenorhabditis auriculariae TaxID=2777116 RepID=A0A8S1H7Y6_9PELO|nr:unnamed protein product [Caenorhabditis auriculariae]